MSSTSPPRAPSSRPLTRRVVLRSAGMVAAGTAVVVPLSACAGSRRLGDDTEPDPLAAESVRARADSAAAVAAIAQFPDSTDTLTVIADQRRAHADALEAEVARLAPPPATSTTAVPEPTTAAPVPPPTLPELSTSLADSSRSAANIARTMSGYRAGLLGSISAACSLASTAVAG